MKARILSALFLAAFALELRALDEPSAYPPTQRGYSVDRSFAMGDLDDVNLFNGNLTYRIPLGNTYTVASSLKYQFFLVYNSKLWDYEYKFANGERPPTAESVRRQPITGRQFNAGFGWTIGLGRLLVESYAYLNNQPWTYVAPDGSTHPFRSTLRGTDDFGSGGDSLYTNDGTYLRLSTITNDPDTPGTDAYRIEFPDGERASFDSSGRLIERSDRYDNWVRVAYSDQGVVHNGYEEIATYKVWTITDGSGPTTHRTHTLRFIRSPEANDPLGYPGSPQFLYLPEYLELATAGFTTLRYTFTYGRDEVDAAEAACGSDIVGDPEEYFVPQLLRITNNASTSEWKMTYAYTGPGGCGTQGALKSVQLPTFAKHVFTWGTYQRPTKGCVTDDDDGYSDITGGLASRQILDRDGQSLGTWTYEPQFGSVLLQRAMMSSCDQSNGPVNYNFYPFSTTTVTSPDGDDTVYYYSTWSYTGEVAYTTTYGEYAQPFTRLISDSGRFLSKQFFDGSVAAGTLLREEYVTMEHDGSDHEGRWTNPRRSGTRTVFRDDPVTPCTSSCLYHYVDEAHSLFDSLGHYRLTTSTTSFGASLQRSSYTNYNPDQPPYPVTWLLNRFDYSWSREGSKVAKKLFKFDDTTGAMLASRTLAYSDPVAVTDLQLVAAAVPAGTTDLLTVYTRDPVTGEITMEEHYGGDLNPLTDPSPFVPPAHNEYSVAVEHTYLFGSHASSRHVQLGGTPFDFFTANKTIDSNTGLVTVTRDTALNATTLTYDKFGRLTLVQAPKIGGIGDANQRYAYYDATPTAAARAESWSDSTAGSQVAVYFDGIGRATWQYTLTPERQWAVKRTTYNVAEQKASESESAYYPSPLTAKTEYLNYDPFGRVLTIRPPEGSSHDVTFQYKGIRETIQTTKIAGTGGVEFPSVRSEIRDGFGRLWKVTENSGPSGQAVTTVYTYDLADRLTSVSTTGVAGEDSQLRTFNYDHRGFLVNNGTGPAEVHPEVSVYHSNYDPRGRARRTIRGTADLTFVLDRAERLQEVRATATQLTLKHYEYGTTGVDLGKLIRSHRINYGAAPNGANITVTEAFSHAGRSGRVSQKVTTLSGGVNETYTQSFTYNDLGLESAANYPTCSGVAGCSSVAARSIPFEYAAGMLRRVGTVAGPLWGTLSYHPSGAVARVAHANGVTDTISIDATVSTSRPSELAFTGFTDPAPPAGGPSILSITPANGPRAGGSVVTVVGSNFQSTSIVHVGGTALVPTFVDSSTLRFTTPAKSSGWYAVRITNTDGQFAERAQGFFYQNDSYFYAVSPCRFIDTRTVTDHPGGALPASTSRTYTLAGACGIPTTAKAVSANLTVTQPTAAGNLIAWPANLPQPSVSAISFAAGQTIANNTRLMLPTDGSGRVTIYNLSSGTVHLIVDINGYFD